VQFIWTRATSGLFGSPATGILVFVIKLRLSHLRGQHLLNYLVRSNSFSDTAHVCRHRSGHVHYSSVVFGINRNLQNLLRPFSLEYLTSSSCEAAPIPHRRFFYTRPPWARGRWLADVASELRCVLASACCYFISSADQNIFSVCFRLNVTLFGGGFSVQVHACISCIH